MPGISFEEMATSSELHKLGLKISPMEALLLAHDKKANEYSRILFLDSIEIADLTINDIEKIGELLRDESFVVRIQAVRVTEKFYVDLVAKMPKDLSYDAAPYLNLEPGSHNAGDCMSIWAGFIEGLTSKK